MNPDNFNSLLQQIAAKIYVINFYLAISGILLNIAHLIILCQSLMRISSTNSILMGIAFSDLVVLSVVIYDKIYQFWFAEPITKCIDAFEYSQWMDELQRDLLEHSSLWLGVFLALIRLIIMKIPKPNTSISRPDFGYVIVMIVFSITLMSTALFYFGIRINAFPGITKSGCPMLTMELINKLKMLEICHGGSQILISLIYPILAILLVLLIWKSSRNSTVSRKCLNDRLRSAKMILIMTILYVICCGPYGFLDFMNLIVPTNEYVIFLLLDPKPVFITFLFCFNSLSHSFLNFVMSSKYRETAKSLLRLKKQKTIGITVSNSTIRPNCHHH
ncbi:Protein CBG10511 [Caenorhabditis briggsae]|uniref:Protein CBG10511 n=1 Tax=Caenorhabditis briggsae TaxID=6238 RepID=A8XAZ2_CAEBR|nr:Protein CBG10511 [Caenorhabditis briggsae]CAP29920.2 Protein CBG10511 [Caenorhabditis briggsae]